MDMNFAIGLSQGIAWPWPIAVYLFLAGISGGAVAAAVILNLYRKQAHETQNLGFRSCRRRRKKVDLLVAQANPGHSRG